MSLLDAVPLGYGCSCIQLYTAEGMAIKGRMGTVRQVLDRSSSKIEGYRGRGERRRRSSVQ
jgi:hypothetical protein